MKVWLLSVNSITMITDMLRKRFGAEPQTGATLMPLSEHARLWPRDAAILDRMFHCS